MNTFLIVASASDNAVGGIISLILMVVMAAGFYFLPTIIAFANKKSNSVAIGALNFFLGWTLLGWVVSLVWSLSKDNKPRKVIVNQQPHVKKEDGLDKLSRLKKLLDEKAISQEEYEIEKGKILKI